MVMVVLCKRIGLATERGSIPFLLILAVRQMKIVKISIIREPTVLRSSFLGRSLFVFIEFKVLTVK